MAKEARVTSAALVEKDGKYLLAERSKKNANGYWVIPGGGVEFGESIQEAAVRELKEETGLDVEIIRRICYKEIINVPGNYHSIVFFHLAKPLSTGIEVSDDVSDAKFLSIEEIKKLPLVQSTKQIFCELGLWEDELTEDPHKTKIRTVPHYPSSNKQS